jgi:hypothetical protein
MLFTPLPGAASSKAQLDGQFPQAGGLYRDISQTRV